MAQIDLKNCYIRMYDRAAPTLEHDSAAANSDVTFTRNYHTGSFPIFIQLIDPGSTGSLSIAKTYTTAGALTIAVTLAYSGSAVTTTAAQLKTALDADALVAQLLTITVEGVGSGLVDALAATEISTPAIEYVEVKIGTGSLTYTVTQNREYILNRGLLDDVRDADQEPMSVDLAAQWEYVKGLTGSPTPIDALNQLNDAADWSSTDSDSCNPYCIDIELDNRPASCSTREVFIFPMFRVVTEEYDSDSGLISLSGSCNVVRPTIIRF